ncbi:MAG: hypothetical protein DRN20_05780 [Thermoplasmata archaeon]|nr:MAG: hypothetical protein DRN20_05780 [Thermoplasmata archaeon]
MKQGHTRTLRRAILIILAILILASIPAINAAVTELNVNPEVINPGDVITVSGRTSTPNEEVWLSSSFELSLPVSDGKYSREFLIHIPAGEKKFSVTAERIKNIRVSLWGTIEYPLDGPLNATNGTATISVSFPITWHGITIDISGKNNVKVYGAAAEDATAVTLKVSTSIKVIADSNGNFSLDINTEGVPEGEFVISAGEKEKTVHIGVTPTPTPTLSPTLTPTSTDTSTLAPTPTFTPSPSPSQTPTSPSTPTSTPIVTLPPPLTPTPTITLSQTPSPTTLPVVTSSSLPGPSHTPKPSKRWIIPGFEAVFVIACLLAFAYLMLRRRRND